MTQARVVKQDQKHQFCYGSTSVATQVAPGNQERTIILILRKQQLVYKLKLLQASQYHLIRLLLLELICQLSLLLFKFVIPDRLKWRSSQYRTDYCQVVECIRSFNTNHDSLVRASLRIA